ncbi:hypothetical protein GQ53DRAFT_96711 [Thozetella sp. PMI_491]|nr:hypothetical protein GQ53DRAFT_96711 [Thozetella sp. PMI_491]
MGAVSCRNKFEATTLASVIFLVLMSPFGARSATIFPLSPLRPAQNPSRAPGVRASFLGVAPRPSLPINCPRDSSGQATRAKRKEGTRERGDARGTVTTLHWVMGDKFQQDGTVGVVTMMVVTTGSSTTKPDMPFRTAHLSTLLSPTAHSCTHRARACTSERQRASDLALSGAEVGERRGTLQVNITFPFVSPGGDGTGRVFWQAVASLLSLPSPHDASVSSPRAQSGSSVGLACCRAETALAVA